MRLLYTASDGRLRWTEDLIGDKIPSYAILSHTWKEGQEVTFADLKDLDNAADIEAHSKEGCRKLRFCAQQARRDGLDYFWVDTCCIDKANNTELSEAINSMFRWYQNAKKCYVFLSDVEHDTLEGDGGLAFRKSRWFDRGWTLQELLAPHSVEFFSKDGARLGDKDSLSHTIHEITGVPIEALSGSDLSQFNIAERFSWAANRQTTREEDGAYCLLGIFDINLPLIYGEGKEKALKRLKKEIDIASKDVADGSANSAEIRSQGQKERLGKIYSWLSAPDPSTNYHKAHKQRQAGTGLWLLESASFTKWKTSAASRLWLYGIPGCGKTILSSTVVEHLLQHCHSDASMVTAYFYFDFNDTQKQDPELMLCSLLRQLLQRSVTLPKGVEVLFSAYENGDGQPSLHALLELMPQVVQQFTHAYIILDALDDRKERDIESSLESYIKEKDTICLQKDVVDCDIQQYVQQRLSNDKTLAKWSKDAAIRQEIEAALMHGACGMFRWAVCQLDMLAQCRNRATLRKSLATLPQTLDQTYDRILTAISEQDSDFAMRILQWLTFSARPMSVEEIAEVVAIDVAREPAFDRDEVLEDPLEAINICSSLVAITTNNAEGRKRPTQRIIALAHYSVQEYLMSDRIKRGQAKQYSMEAVECHNMITEGCLKYLMQLQGPISMSVLETSTLARYAAEFWSSHFRKTEDKRIVVSQVAMRLMSIEQPAYPTWIQLFDPDMPRKEPDLRRGLESIAMPLYYTALLGLRAITRSLLDQGADVNTQGGQHGNALYAASWKGHEQVVKILLDADADVNAQGGRHGNALQAASVKGHEQVVKILLDAGADVNAQGGAFNNALYAASRKGYKQIVQMLLNAGADVNAQGGHYGNALQAASREGHKQIVQMLLDAGADVNAQGGRHGNALQAALKKGHEQIVQMLLDAGVDVNAQGGAFNNALYVALRKGYEQIVQMLLNAGADVNAQGGYYGNTLQAASREGHEQIVQMLLDAGADVNIQGGHYGNALQAASAKGHEQIVQMLLDAGADVNVQGGHYGNALQAASAEDHEQIVQMLLDAGADVNAQGGHYGNALQAASREGHEQVVKILLNTGADVNAQGVVFNNALYAASWKGCEQIVQILLDAGADVNTQGGHYGNVLQAASRKGHEQVVKMLLDAGVNVNAQGGAFNNALYAASWKGCEQIVQILLGAGADVNTQSGRHSNALQVASAKGHDQVVKILLNAGADVHAQGGHYGNALQAASAEDHEQIVQMLLDAGADVNIQGGHYGNALQAASAKGHEQIVQMLLDAGADVHAQGGHYGNALQAASAKGHEQIVQMLLDAGADVNAQGGHYGNALQAASNEGYEQIVQMLLDAGADVNAQGGHYGNALQAASNEGYEQIVQMLLDAGADVNAQGGHYGNALQAASNEGYEQIVQMLLDAGADVNAQGGHYGNALQAASNEGYEQIVQMLLDAGADVNAQGGHYGNALQAASNEGHEQVVKMLLDAGAH
ncbi:putative multiple ankyrin repeats single kh domain protein [Curvularia clavata]|uniref:Multiple ankyrin repeats single kh domain protein n=1 Tax=Curvularia clavata TaxID=95742 RepID=A0A9Q9DQ75_CURCL|nr:putative multiple ankyrin repeats single kh domain protein [Curvularia clavata]